MLLLWVGGHCSDGFAQDIWSVAESKVHINILELYPVRLALTSSADLLPRQGLPDTNG